MKVKMQFKEGVLNYKLYFFLNWLLTLLLLKLTRVNFGIVINNDKAILLKLIKKDL